MQGSYLAGDLRKVISIVDLLRDIGLGSQLSLPKVVVLGNQSSGKSSLLEQIVGLDFLPRGSGVVTRRPLELRMNNVPTLANPYAEFDEIIEKGVRKKFSNFNDVRRSIDEVTDNVCGKEKQIVDKPIVLNVFSKSCPNLTIVDLPGITSIPIASQPKNIYQITKQMALRYITEKRSIILCVIPANQDLATSQALKIMREIDPTGERSIGCLTKIDIMNRGDDARQILKNKEIPLRYGYVGIKNRNQEDINNNIPVSESINNQKKFFTTSPIYSTLPMELFGTHSLTNKLTTILYQQIKSSMPEIFEEIKKKKKTSQEELEKLGPGVANTDAEMVNYAWKSIASFLRIFKNSLNGIKNSDYSKDPISAEIREELNLLYKEQYDDAATQLMRDKEIQKAMINFPGDSTIPGFPSIDAFLALLNPLLKKLQAPAYEINQKVHQIMEKEATNIISTVLTSKFPDFNSRFLELVRKILDKHRKMLETFLGFLLDSELNYLYTNDLMYLMGDFNKPENFKDKKKETNANPLIYELRKRIDAFFKLVVRNLRDLVPKQIFNFLLIKCLKQLEFEAFQFTSDVNKLKEWLNEPEQIKVRRLECIKAIKVFEESEKRIRMDPDISKLVKSSDKINKFYDKYQMKSPEQMQQEEIQRKNKFYSLTARNSLINDKEKDNKKGPSQPPSGGGGSAQKTTQLTTQKPVPKEPVQQPTVKVQPNQPKQNQPQKKADFDDFLGIKKQGQQSPQPSQAKQNPATQQSPAQNNEAFKNFFGQKDQPKTTNPPPSTGGVNHIFGVPNQPPPTQAKQVVPPPAQTKPVQPTTPPPPPQDKDKKKTFNKLFGI